jgi:hypothetical protein
MGDKEPMRPRIIRISQSRYTCIYFPAMLLIMNLSIVALFMYFFLSIVVQKRKMIAEFHNFSMQGCKNIRNQEGLNRKNGEIIQY